jgi:hypothetical protein
LTVTGQRNEGHVEAAVRVCQFEQVAAGGGAAHGCQFGTYLAQIGAAVDQIIALFPSSQPKTALVVSLGGK